MSAFIEALNGQGFACETTSTAAGWKTLTRPMPSDASEYSEKNYTYVSSESTKKFLTSLSENKNKWGLIFADHRFKAEFPPHLPALFVRAPDAAMDFLLSSVLPTEAKVPMVAKQHSYGTTVNIEENVSVGPHCHFGDGVVIESFVRVGARVTIGKNTRIGAFTRIADDSVIGEDCQLHSHVSIGAPGFGFVKYPQKKHLQQRTHVGHVVIDNGVRLGAFVAIDSAVLGVTRIDSNVAIDNIVQVAHNCTVGAESLLCSMVGLSGSTSLGKNVTIAGQSGTKGHLHIGDNVTIGAQSGITKDIEANATVKGYPARPLKEAIEIQVLMGRLPDLFARLKKLEEAK